MFLLHLLLLLGELLQLLLDFVGLLLQFARVDIEIDERFESLLNDSLLLFSSESLPCPRYEVDHILTKGVQETLGSAGIIRILRFEYLAPGHLAVP